MMGHDGSLSAVDPEELRRLLAGEQEPPPDKVLIWGSDAEVQRISAAVRRDFDRKAKRKAQRQARKRNR